MSDDSWPETTSYPSECRAVHYTSIRRRWWWLLPKKRQWRLQRTDHYGTPIEVKP